MREGSEDHIKVWMGLGEIEIGWICRIAENEIEVRTY